MLSLIILKVIPHTYIAEYCNISNMSVQRIVDRVYDNETLYKHYLSEVLCIDEFTALKKKWHLIFVMEKMVKH